MALGELNDRSRDIMCLRIGNVPPKCKVRITMQFMQSLEVTLNTFWRLSVQSHVWPRYLNDGGRKLGQKKPSFTWTFKVEVRAASRCVYTRSTSHKLQELSRNERGTEVLLALPESEVPTGDFVLLYTTEDFEQPQLVRGRTDTSQSCLLSFIPRFNQLSLTDAERMELEKRPVEPELDRVTGEYVFLLDRSGSMNGGRIAKAK